jgi:hypothetical protein
MKLRRDPDDGTPEGGITMVLHQTPDGSVESAKGKKKKRKCTPEELAAIARANGACSHGPTSEAGRDACRRGRLTHGLTAETVALETEDQAELDRNTQWWFDTCRPRSPAAHLLVTACARSDIMIRRVWASHDAASSQHVWKTGVTFEQGRENLVAEFVAAIPQRPAESTEGLRRFSHGCVWLLGRWTEFQNDLLK